VDGVLVSKLERAVINNDFYYDNRENPGKYKQILIDGEKVWVIRPWFTKEKKEIKRKKDTKVITDKIKSVLTPKKVEVKKLDTKPDVVKEKVVEEKESTTPKTNKPKVEDFRKENNMINMKEYFKALREWKQQNK